MKILLYLLATAAAVGLLALLCAYICYYITFHVPKKRPVSKEEYPIPPGKIYEPFQGVMTAWMKEVRALPHEEVSITSFDGLTLHGKFYEYAPGAPIELMFHGYRGSAERDLPGGVQRCFAVGRSTLLVDQRCSGKSDGSTITFGIKEHKDCLSWIDFAVNRFGPNVKIILTGISMGASTVLMAAGQELPENVAGVLADCGYTSPRAIIQKVLRQLKLPVMLVYPFIKLGAKLYGHFDLEESSPIESVRNCRVPVIFYHGEDDDFVPCSMSKENYDACASRKALVTVPGAGHGLSFPVEEKRYIQTLQEFFGPELSYNKTPVA